MSSNGCTYCVYIVQENLQKIYRKNPPTSFLQHANTKSDEQTDIHVPQNLHLWG